MPYYQRLQTPIIGQIFMLYFLTFTLPQGAHVLHLFLYISGVIGDKLRIYIYSRKNPEICTTLCIFFTENFKICTYKAAHGQFYCSFGGFFYFNRANVHIKGIFSENMHTVCIFST